MPAIQTCRSEISVAIHPIDETLWNGWNTLNRQIFTRRKDGFCGDRGIRNAKQESGKRNGGAIEHGDRRQTVLIYYIAWIVSNTMREY